MGILKNEQNYLISDDGSYLIYNESSSQNILFTETFDSGVGTTPPENWDTEVVSGGNTISFVTTNTAPVVSPYEGTKFVLFNSFEVSSGQNRLKRTTSVSSIGYSNVSLSFAWYEDSGYGSTADRVTVQWSTNGDVWTNTDTYNRYNLVTGWKIKTSTLPIDATNQPTLYVAFLFTSTFGNNCSLDYARLIVS